MLTNTAGRIGRHRSVLPSPVYGRGRAAGPGEGSSAAHDENVNYVIHEAWRSGVKRLVFLGSSCITPRDCPQPIKEEYLLTGPLEETNLAYAIAKNADIESCAAYNKQSGTQFLCAMPTNHVVPAEGEAGEEHGRNDVPADIVAPCESERRASRELGARCMHRARRTGRPCRAFRGSGPSPLHNLIAQIVPIVSRLASV